MRAEIDHRALEAGIAHNRHRDQQLTVEVAVFGRIVAGAGLLAANLARSFALRIHPRRSSQIQRYPDIGLPFCQSSISSKALRRVDSPSQAIQWFAAMLNCKDVA